MLSTYKHRKMLLAKGADPDLLPQWEAIDPDIAGLLLSAGVSLDTYAEFKTKGLTEYKHFNDAIIRNLNVEEILAEKRADEQRARAIEQSLKDEQARLLRASTGSWDDEPKPGQAEHWYFTPEKIAEFRARPDTGRRMPFGDRCWVAFVTTIGWFGSSTAFAGLLGSTLHTVGYILLGAPFAVGTAVGAVKVTSLFSSPSYLGWGDSVPDLLDTNEKAWSDESNDESWRYSTGYARALDHASWYPSRVEYTWAKVVRPAVEAGAHPSNMDRWMSLSVEVRENALTNRTGINMAERIDARLATRVVTPLVFIETLEELEYEDQHRVESHALRALPQLVADITSGRSVIGTLARRLLA